MLLDFCKSLYIYLYLLCWNVQNESVFLTWSWEQISVTFYEILIRSFILFVGMWGDEDLSCYLPSWAFYSFINEVCSVWLFSLIVSNSWCYCILLICMLEYCHCFMEMIAFTLILCLSSLAFSLRFSSSFYWFFFFGSNLVFWTLKVF